MMKRSYNRRAFLTTSATSIVAASCGNNGAATEPPLVTDPRATDGDDQHEPTWEERFAITVGRSDADLIGEDDRVIQAAVDYVARRGGGTVNIKPGTYTLRNAIQLASGIRIVGSGPETIITKHASNTVRLTEDSDWYDQEITLADSSGFDVGDGVVLRAKNPHNGGQEVIKRTLVARHGNRFRLNEGLRKNLWLSGTPTCSSTFPLLTSEYTQNVEIADLTLDGNRANNELLDGNYGGCIFLQDCRRYQIRNVTAKNYHGDGISFQICHDVKVQDCRCFDNANLGLHPGSGSQRPVILRNELARNNIGLFWCWGVKYGLAEGNRINDNRQFGVSIGHNDTNNVMRDNDIRNSGQVGILFRDDDRGKDFWANRNTIENNRIVNSGGRNGAAIDIYGKTKDVRIIGNELTETRSPEARVGVRIRSLVGPVELQANRFSGFSANVVDERFA